VLGIESSNPEWNMDLSVFNCDGFLNPNKYTPLSLKYEKEYTMKDENTCI
jgi:hypothetical protein